MYLWEGSRQGHVSISLLISQSPPDADTEADADIKADADVDTEADTAGVVCWEMWEANPTYSCSYSQVSLLLLKAVVDVTWLIFSVIYALSQ